MKTIAVAGCTEHIGTTTQSIQMVRYLQESGLKACYIELNETGYVEQLLKLYHEAEDKITKAEYCGITIYKKSFLKTIPCRNWDFIIKDYGNANDITFKENSFINQTLKIIVCGSKPNEIFKLQKILIKPEYNDSYFIFSFVPESERVSIMSLMGKRAKYAFFSGIILDPFTLTKESKIIDEKISVVL
ncbi:hypothetical protein [Hungatella hathewayi]|uniref:hypothetical protein n=1 Tax=Hungatella hathewayi TaxID=154046 RepID=UPI003561EA68